MFLPNVKYLTANKFDSRLQWGAQVSNVIHTAKRALHAIRLIRRYFNRQELSQLLTANFYSILYYDSDIWHVPGLSSVLRNHLMSASALKICTPNYHYFCRLKHSIYCIYYFTGIVGILRYNISSAL